MYKLILLLGLASVVTADFFGRQEYSRTPVGDSIDVATMKVLKETYSSQENKNIVLSPLGVMLLLSLYKEGAGPATSSQITSFLGGTDAERSSSLYKQLSERLSSMDRNHLTVAYKTVVSDQFTLKRTFVEAAYQYRSEVETADFSNAEETANKINRWAAETTNGHITEPVDKSTIPPDAAAALFNIIFFKGSWHVPFKAEETKEKDFYLSKTNVTKKQMMHLQQSLYYTASEELGAKMIELPYKEYGFRMVVVLPDEVDGLPAVLDKVAQTGLAADIASLQPAGRDVILDMPKFDIRTKINLNDVLQKVGLNKLFEEGAPGVVNEQAVKVDKVFQEAFISVNEEGATAGAFTGAVMVPYSEPPQIPLPIQFTVDHPFLYAILHEDKILFVGTYSG